MSKHPHHICKNCGNHFTGNFCNLCGQSAHIHEINQHFVWHELKHSFLHWDAGITYSIKQLFSRPGHSIREFLEGKRVKHFSPVGLVLFLAGIYGVIAISAHLDLSTIKEESEEVRTVIHSFNEWSAHHYASTQLLILPFLTIASYLLFRKQGYNFFEHVILNSFITAQKIVVGFCFLPLLFWQQGTEQLQLIINVQFLTNTLFSCWTYAQFFRHLSKSKAWLLGFGTQILLLIQTLLVLTIAIEVFSWINWHKFI